MSQGRLRVLASEDAVTTRSFSNVSLPPGIFTVVLRC